jgi:hypothetical protein
MPRTGVTETAVRSWLRGRGVALNGEPRARQAVGLARRLDGDPGDHAAVELSRELRQLLVAVEERYVSAERREVEEFLASIQVEG